MADRLTGKAQVAGDRTGETSAADRFVPAAAG